jgi:hypothetical protein
MTAFSLSAQDYANRYGLLPPMERSSLKNMFGNGVAAHSKSLVTRQAKEVLPGVFSFHPLVLEFQEKLASGLNIALPVDMNVDKFTTTGIHTPFDRLRTVSGYMANPMSYTMLDNAKYRKELGLKPGYSASQRRIATEVWTEIFSSYKPSKVKVTKKSQSGPRRNTTDHEWKLDFALFLFQAPRFEAMLQALDKDDWFTLANEFETLYMMYIQKRDQVDTPGKERIVFDLEYALSNGDTGNAFPADKTVVIDGKEYADFNGTRTRVVHAGPWSINCFLSIMATGHMQAMFINFPNTWHINTDIQITDIINGRAIWCGDVKEYDRSMPEEAIDHAHEVMEKFWDHRMVKASRSLYYSPYYARPLQMEGTSGQLVGDPRLLGKQVVAGNRSGHAFTSLIAKGMKVIETLDIFSQMGLQVEGRCKAFLKGTEVIGCINNGDDETVHAASDDILLMFKVIRENIDNGIYSVEAEDGQVYSGKILRVDKYGDKIYHPTPRLATGFEKMYVPERSIGGVMRPHWEIGFTERIISRDLHPMGGIAWEIHDRLFHDILAPRFGTLIGMISDAAMKSKLSFNEMSEKDRDVIDSPEKLYYKYADGEISAEVIALTTTNIDFENFEHIVDRYYSGHVIH